jgi:hypothetical protein
MPLLEPLPAPSVHVAKPPQNEYVYTNVCVHTHTHTNTQTHNICAYFVNTKLHKDTNANTNTNTHTQGINAYGPGVCIACRLGHSTQANTGYSSCTLCIPGSYADKIGTHICSLCLPGSYQDNEGETGCVSCPVNTYTNFSGAAGCLRCPFGKFSRPAAKALTDCRKGHIELTPDQQWGDILEQVFLLTSAF